MGSRAEMHWQRPLLSLLLLLVSTASQGHLLKLFAYVEGEYIHGSVYFAGGAGVAGARIKIAATDGKLLATLRSDSQGAFSQQIEQPADYRILADSADRHRAEWLIQRSEFSTGGVAETPFHKPQNRPTPDTPQTDAQLAALVERAVARQIGPLRQQLQQQADRARLGDIVGGIGFIFGIAGLLMWWRSRRESEH